MRVDDRRTGTADGRGGQRPRADDADALPVGNVQLHVESDGFTPVDRMLTLRRGSTNQTVTLGIAGLQEEIVVSDAAADDTRGNSLTTTLEEDEIAELSDDPDELRAQLEAMTGGAGAVFQVNGFRGGRLPNRDEIRQIRFRTNSFSADNHDAGRVQVEIITQARPHGMERQRELRAAQRRAQRAERVCAHADARAVPPLHRRPARTARARTARRCASTSTATVPSIRARSSRCCRTVASAIR